MLGEKYVQDVRLSRTAVAVDTRSKQSCGEDMGCQSGRNRERERGYDNVGSGMRETV